ncbi:MAG: BamA/TamA family outer membrane protein [Gemmatimonadetes bacterium]|nr:BamA/TamA family outer membrane protein [Gemmatimonadota bacterium]
MRKTERQLLFTICVVCAALGVGVRRVSAMERLHYQDYPALDGLVVRQVLVLGNTNTREIVFRREMRLTEGVPFSSEALWRDWERLVDLGLFAHLEVDAVPSEGGVLVVVSAYERPRWLAAPILDYDFDTKEVRYGYAVRVRNAQGLNRTIRHRATAGDKNRATFTYSTPWLGDRRQELAVGLNLELPRREETDLLSNRLLVGSTWYVGDYRELRQGITGYTGLERLTRSERSEDGSVNQLSPVLGARWSRDSRNVRIDPSRGSLLQFGTEYDVGLLEDGLQYVRTSADARAFRRIGVFVLAGRMSAVGTKGHIPEYRQLSVGGNGTIRGRESEVDQGNSIAFASAELRFPILPQVRFSIPVPGVLRRISNVDLRVDGAVFVDTGTAWEDRHDIGATRFHTGAGFGLRIFLPVLELARFELAFDPDGNPTVYFREGNQI